MKRKILVAGLLLLVLLFIAWSFYREWDAILVFPWVVEPVRLLVSFTLYAVQLLLMFAAWRSMVRFMGGSVPLGLDASVYFLSAAARRIPTPVWYLGSRFSLYPPELVTPAAIVVCSVLEVALVLLAGLVFVIFMIPFYPVMPGIYAVFSVLVGAVLVAVFYRSPNLLVLLINRFFDWFKKKRVDASIGRKNLFEWLFLYLLVYLFNAGSMYFLIIGIMDVRPEVGAVTAVSAIYMILAYVSMFLTAGFGLKEIATSFFFARWMPISIGIAVALLYRLLMTIVELVFVALVKLLAARTERGALARQDKL
jgi:uncharacterized membrane protein YbhN (UPF0104 family)